MILQTWQVASRTVPYWQWWGRIVTFWQGLYNDDKEEEQMYYDGADKVNCAEKTMWEMIIWTS